MSSSLPDGIVHDAIQSSQFLKGFICGQVLLSIFAILLFHFLFFIGPFELRRRQKLRKSSTNNTITSTTRRIRNSIAVYREILGEFDYNPSLAEPESCKWANIMIAQLLAKARHSDYLRHRILGTIEKAISKSNDDFSSDLLRGLKITSLSLGTKFPYINAVKVNYSESGRIRTDFKIEWVDEISIGLEGMVAINWPIDLFAALPFQVTVTMSKLSGVLSIEFPDDTGDECETIKSRGPEALSRVQLTFLHDAMFELDVKSVIGHRTKVKDMSKVADILSAVIRNAIEEEIVWPNYKLFEI